MVILLINVNIKIVSVVHTISSDNFKFKHIKYFIYLT